MVWQFNFNTHLSLLEILLLAFKKFYWRRMLIRVFVFHFKMPSRKSYNLNYTIYHCFMGLHNYALDSLEISFLVPVIVDISTLAYSWAPWTLGQGYSPDWVVVWCSCTIYTYHPPRSISRYVHNLMKYCRREGGEREGWSSRGSSGTPSVPKTWLPWTHMGPLAQGHDLRLTIVYTLTF